MSVLAVFNTNGNEMNGNHINFNTNLAIIQVSQV